MEKDQHYWDWDCTPARYQATCATCNKVLCVAFQPHEPSDVRILALINFLHTVDAHELQCWGEIIQAFDMF